MSKEKKRNAIPPYVPYRTFHNFVDGLNPVPPVIDSAVLKTMGGALRSQLLSSLRYLKLIEPDGKTRPALRTLAASKGDDKKKELNKLLIEAYPFLFQTDSSGFSLSEGTSPQFYGKFQTQGASGDTVKRCGKFFLDVAKDAGIIISPYIVPEGVTKSKNDNSKPTKRHTPARKPKDLPGEESGYEIQPSKWYATFKSAFDKLPDFDKAHWTSTERNKWIALVTALVDAYVDTDDEKKK